MKKMYSVEENKKIEDGKKRLVSDTISVKEFLDDLPVTDFPNLASGWLNEDGAVPVKLVEPDFLKHDDLSDLIDPMIDIKGDRPYQHIPEPKVEYRSAEPKDIIYDNMIQIRLDKDPYIKDIRIVTVLNPSDSYRAFIGNDGKTYGLEFSFVKVKK